MAEKGAIINSLVEKVMSLVDPGDIWRYYYPDWEPGHNVSCAFHEDSNPSMSLSETGKAFCHGCGWRCSSPVGFVMDKDKCTFRQALRRIRFRHSADVIPPGEWKAWHKYLLESQELLEELKLKRGLTLEMVKRFKLGWCMNRLTIPIIDEFGCCVNVKRHDALRRCPKGSPKVFQYRKDWPGAKARLYPVESLKAENSKIYLFEGELNTILACGMGLPATCVTGGARVWNEEFTPRFAGRKVVVCHDVNDPDNAGQEGAKIKCSAMLPTAAWVKNLILPLSDRGGDFTDYAVKYGHSLTDFLSLESASQYVTSFQRNGEEGSGSSSKTSAEKLNFAAATPIKLKEAAHNENFGKPLRVQCMVASMDLAPFVPPSKVHISCLEFKLHQASGKIPPKCGSCWMPETGLEKDIDLTPDRREVIAMLEKNDATVDSSIRAVAELPQECNLKIEVKEVHNVHAIGIVPDTPREKSGSEERHDYVMRTGYFFGKTIEANRAYELSGFSMSHPDTQQVTHVFVKAKSALSAVERFSLDATTAQQLDSLFATPGDPYEKLMEIYDDFARTITRIVMRPLLHAAVDLVWHSPLQFTFNGEKVHKGWLEAIVFGDTRCGKGYVAENLSRHYGLGTVVSGENCTVAGLVGGLETMGRRMVLRWGAIPLNDRGLVIVDEMGDMPEELFGRLSRVRSEGVAEVTKIGHHQKTYARTRLMWLCNPREGVMSDYTYGVQALQGIVGKAEDIARFDYAFAVADGEVPTSIINAMRYDKSQSKFTSGLCRALVYWAWSRKADQVCFTEKAVDEILNVHAKELAAKYSATIPLIQGQNVRIKLAKMSAAVAARLFSHPRGNYEILQVNSRHAETAARLLDEFYKTKTMAYDSYSRKARGASVLVEDVDLKRIFPDTKPEDSLRLVRCLLSRRISVRAIAAAAKIDKTEAEEVYLDALLRCNAVQERANGYFALKGNFKDWLEKKEQELERKMENRRKA